MPVVSQLAPDIVLPDQTGATKRLGDFRGSYVLLYFYPKDDTPGCTIESCGFRDLHPEFLKRNCIVIGISADDVDSHKRFAEHHSLPFSLLADVDRRTIDEYETWKDAEKKTGIARTSFLIDPDGKIVKIYAVGEASVHPAEVLRDLDNQG